MQVKINGAQIGYDDFGQGPVVLFIHEYLLDRQMWKPQIEPLVAAGFRVIMIDLRGCGESALDKNPVDLQTHSADIIGLLNYLGIGRAAICELSFGGSVLCHLIENYPRRIAGAYLANSHSIQPSQCKLPVTALKVIGHRNNNTECNPITHQRPTATLPDLDPKVQQNSGRLVNMENATAFNRHLLDFLSTLAPRRKGAALTPLSSAA